MKFCHLATLGHRIMNSKQQEGGGGGGTDSRNATPTKKKRGRPRKNSPRFIKRSNKNEKGVNNKEAAKTLFPDQGRYSVLPWFKFLVLR